MCIKQLMIGTVVLASVAGCGGGYSALEPGNQMPSIQAVGWTNGEKPHDDDLSGKVVVLEAFATW